MHGHAKRKTRILVTGFGSFPGMRDNPSGRLIDWLEDDARWERRTDLSLYTKRLPVDWNAMPALVARQAAEIDPDIVIHFGVHSNARGFTVENYARNRTAMMADALGCEWDQHQIVPRAPHLLRAPKSARKLATHLVARGLPAVPSSDAGAYLCNMLFFLTLEQRHRTGRPALAQFVHIPPLALQSGRTSPNAITRETLHTGVTAIIRYNLANFRSGDLRQHRQRTE